MLGNLSSKELFLFSYYLLPPAVAGPSRKELHSDGQNSLVRASSTAYLENRKGYEVYFDSIQEDLGHILHVGIILIKSVSRHHLPENVDDWNVEIVPHQHVRVLDNEKEVHPFYFVTFAKPLLIRSPRSKCLFQYL